MGHICYQYFVFLGIHECIINSNESFDYHKCNSRNHLFLKNWSPSARVYSRICKFHLFHNFTGKIQLFAISGAVLESRVQAIFYIINNYSGMLWIFQLLIIPPLYPYFFMKALVEILKRRVVLHCACVKMFLSGALT